MLKVLNIVTVVKVLKVFEIFKIVRVGRFLVKVVAVVKGCLLYTSDAADE